MKWEQKRRAPKAATGKRRAGAALIGLALMAGWPAFASERQVIPFEINEEDHMVVQLGVNEGGKTTGIIDTAATFPMIDGKTARLAGIPELAENPPMVNVLGVTGRQLYPVVRLDSLMVGNVLKTDPPEST